MSAALGLLSFTRQRDLIAAVGLRCATSRGDTRLPMCARSSAEVQYSDPAHASFTQQAVGWRLMRADALSGAALDRALTRQLREVERSAVIIAAKGRFQWEPLVERRRRLWDR